MTITHSAMASTEFSTVHKPRVSHSYSDLFYLPITVGNIENHNHYIQNGPNQADRRLHC